MPIKKQLLERSNSKCELCSSENELQVYTLPPATDANSDNSILICSTCFQQIEQPESIDVNHWRCLNDSMWSQVPAVQVMVWRLLSHLSSEVWPQDLLDMLYLDDDNLAWAKQAKNISTR